MKEKTYSEKLSDDIEDEVFVSGLLENLLENTSELFKLTDDEKLELNVKAYSKVLDLTDDDESKYGRCVVGKDRAPLSIMGCSSKTMQPIPNHDTDPKTPSQFGTQHNLFQSASELSQEQLDLIKEVATFVKDFKP